MGSTHLKTALKTDLLTDVIQIIPIDSQFDSTDSSAHVYNNPTFLT